MNYVYLGNNQYEITLTVYRDCFNGIPPFDNPATIGIFDSNNNLAFTVQATITSQQSVPNAINSPCLLPPTNVCYEVARYVFTISLPSQTGSYTLAYQRCCRNSSVVNLVNVQGTGATYMAVIADPAVAPVNSNPVFNNWPPTFICQGAPFTFDHSAMDPDGDSLVYRLNTPIHGGSMNDPMPNPPSNPPYNNVVFQTPYSVNDPFGGVPIQINSRTGVLTATPNNQGQYVYGIRVDEYRNGVLIGSTIRDFQVNVVPCPMITVASIYSPTIACGSLRADFVNNSFNAATYDWYFGDPTTTSDTSTLTHPSYTYPDTGDYIATLVAYSGINPLCNDTATGLVHIYPEFITNFVATNEHCSNEFQFIDRSYGLSGSSTTWFWEFGDHWSSFDANPVHLYDLPGDYEVKLITSADSSCTDTAVKLIHVLQNPTADFSLELDTCKYTISTVESSLNAASYRWEFGDDVVDYRRQGKHVYSQPGEYEVHLIVATDSSCVDSASLHVSIPPLPLADFEYTVAPCDSTVRFINKSLFASQFHWQFADYTASNDESPVHVFRLSGTIPVKLEAMSQHGCKNVRLKDIFFVSFKKADFDTSPDTCENVINFIDLTNHAAYLRWDFGDGTLSNEFNPSHRYKNEGEHTVTLYVNAETPCPDTISKIVMYEASIGEKVFIPNTFTPNGDGINDVFAPSIFRPCQVYALTIFNRWGQKVFESNDAANVRWDGDFAGERLPEDIYVYILESEGTRQEGKITIMR